MDVQTDAETDFGPVMRGRSSPFKRKPLDGASSGPGRSPKPRRSSGGRLLRTIVVALAVILLVAVLTGIGLVLYASSQIERQTVSGLQSSRPMNILVTGTDSREGLTREQQLELTTGSEGGNLTDTIFVLQAGGGRTTMLAFPRDLFVTRCDGSRGRINAAVRIGGPSCLVETITDLSGIQISHHLEVNFLGFRDIVDAVGGVEVCLEDAIADREAGLDLPAGCQQLDGVDALGFVRVRKIDNDLERIKRQQRFVKALATEILSPAVLANPSKLFDTTTTVAQAITADQRMGPLDLVQTAWSLRGLAAGLDNAYTVPAGDANVGGASVLAIEEAAAQALFDDFSNGTLLAHATPSSDELQPSQVEVAVLNGARVQGLAGRVAEQLRAQGFVVEDIGNQEATDTTVIRYPPGSLGAAELLRDRSGRNASLVEDPTVGGVTLVLGRDAASG